MKLQCSTIIISESENDDHDEFQCDRRLDSEEGRSLVKKKLQLSTAGLAKFVPIPKFLGIYRIVPSKRPWALAAQAPKFEDERLHGESA